MDICAGDLNKPVKLQLKGKTSDDIGGFEETWSNVADPYWVKIEPLHGRQAYEVGQRFSAVTHVVTGRYQSGISAATHRLVYGDRVFRIEAIINPNEANVLLRFMCEESPAIPERQA